MKVRCPRCKKDALYSPENKFRPFCSERCQMADLGQWAEESFRVPSDEPLDEEAFEELLSAGLGIDAESEPEGDSTAEDDLH